MFFGDNHPANCVKELKINPTNQRAELLAIREALVILNTNNFSDREVTIVSDSMYSINCITVWSDAWKHNNWRSKGGPIKNLEIIREILELMDTIDYKIHFLHVRSHQKEPSKDCPSWKLWYGNKQADLMCNQIIVTKN